MRKRLLLLAILLALIPSAARADDPPPITLSVALSSDRPQPGADLVATIVVFDGAGDVAIAVDLPAGLELATPGPIVVHAAPVGLVVVRLHVASDAAVGARAIVFRGGGQSVSKQIYVGTYPWPPAARPGVQWRLPIIKR